MVNRARKRRQRSENLADRFRREVERQVVPADELDRCYFCKRRTRLGGIWCLDTKTALLLGTPPHRRRFMVYSACAKCRSRPNWKTQLEDSIIDHYRRKYGGVLPPPPGARPANDHVIPIMIKPQ